MRVKLSNNHELIVRFRRENTFKKVAVYGPYNKKYSVLMFHGVMTTCYGMIGEDKVFEASTRHHEEDVFTKAEGRRRALNKALSYSTLSKENHTLIWDAYFIEHADLEK